MSLNGLDASAVVDAHQAALADPSGWFLLKYVTRDTVELLSQGTGGVVEAKSVIEQYEEKSPLYGMIIFRRKKVLLKYVPVGTSRVLQVRLTVQFQSVADAFPQDTIFSFNTPAEFTESALNLSVMLQPSAHGTSLDSSAASIKHRRLDEISEDAEEQTAPAEREITTPMAASMASGLTEEHTPTQSIKSSYESLPPSALKAKALLARRKEAELASNAGSVLSHTRGQDSLTLTLKSAQLSSLDKSLPATPEAELTPPPSRHILSRQQNGAATPPLPRKSDLRMDSRLQERPTAVQKQNGADYFESASRPQVSFDHMSQNLHQSDHLSANESQSISQWNEQVPVYAKPLPKPKKKLAPKPHVESGYRPKTSNTIGMPNTVRSSSRQGAYTPTSGYRPGSQQSSRSVPGRFVPDLGPLPPIPNTHMASLYRVPQPQQASSVISSSAMDTATATPEKMRLMRALQMRKKTHILAQRSATSQSNRPPTSLDERLEQAFKRPEPRPRPDSPTTDSVPQYVFAQTAIHHLREHDSSTASPVSATTASGAHSTKPSSASGEAERKKSPRSSSGHTDSSATPKATTDHHQNMPAQSPVESLQQSEEVANAGTKVNKSHVAKSSIDEALSRLTGETEPLIPQTYVQQSSPVREKAEVLGSDKADPARQANSLLKLPPRSSSHGALLGFGRNSKRLTVQSAARSSANVSIYSDDSLMEEIQYATLHEAKPVHVAGTPVTPTMRKFSSDRIRDLTQAPIIESVEENKEEEEDEAKGVHAEKSKPRSASMKSSSTAQQQWTSDEPMPPLSNKSTLGSSISKRIKALEVLTHRDSVHVSPSSTHEPSGNKSTLSNLMNRASFIAQFHVSKPAPEPQPAPKKAPEPPRTAPSAESEHLNARPLVQRQGEETELFAPSRKGETVSVTARIIREQRRPATSATNRDPETGLNLHRSPLIVEHGRNPSDPAASLSMMSRDISAQSVDTYSTVTADKPRVSLSSFRSGSTIRQFLSDGRSSRMSFMSKKSSRAPSETSSIGEDKKPNRAGRIMKRMSGLSSRFGPKSAKFGASKDHLPQQETILEQAEEDRRDSMTSSMLQMIDIGDVNVQFPETLLWKRRFMRINDQGHLIFSAPTDNAHIRTANRKFHLSELKVPMLPDLEREEMAWSIVIDLKNGKCIQCACGSKSAQESILKMLVDAHYAYNSLYMAP